LPTQPTKPGSAWRTFCKRRAYTQNPLQNHFRPPDNWMWASWTHKTNARDVPLLQAEFWIHRYLATTQAPSYLAALDLKLCQQDVLSREIMFIVTAHYPPDPEKDEFTTRFVTRFESVTEVMGATPRLCGALSSGLSPDPLPLCVYCTTRRRGISMLSRDTACCTVKPEGRFPVVFHRSL
jgi:hypothetical protein